MENQRGPGVTSSVLVTQNQHRTSGPLAAENKHEDSEGAGVIGGTSNHKSVVKPQGNFFDLLAAAVTAVKTDPKAEFQEYLKTSGVKMAWVRAIVALYEEPKKPDDPLAYILKLMGLGIPETNEVKGMQERVKQLRVKLLQLQSENEALKELVQMEEQALDQDRHRQELVSLFDDSKYFSDDSDGDQEDEGQLLGYRFSDSDHRKLGHPQSAI